MVDLLIGWVGDNILFPLSEFSTPVFVPDLSIWRFCLGQHYYFILVLPDLPILWEETPLVRFRYFCPIYRSHKGARAVAA